MWIVTNCILFVGMMTIDKVASKNKKEHMSKKEIKEILNKVNIDKLDYKK